MLRATAFAFALLLSPAVAYAGSCPTQMSAIDAALPNAKLSEADVARSRTYASRAKTFIGWRSCRLGDRAGRGQEASGDR
jgi:hypothetical protein